MDHFHPTMPCYAPSDDCLPYDDGDSLILSCLLASFPGNDALMYSDPHLMQFPCMHAATSAGDGLSAPLPVAPAPAPAPPNQQEASPSTMSSSSSPAPSSPYTLPLMGPLLAVEEPRTDGIDHADPEPASTKRPRRSKQAPPPYASNMLNLYFPKPKPAKTPVKRRRQAARAEQDGVAATGGRRMYQCDIDGCGKRFTRPYNLKSHRRTHTLERPYACELCPKRFARQHDRNRHARLHSGVKAYVCQHCGKAFTRQDALNRHQRPLGQPEVVCCKRKGRRAKDKREAAAAAAAAVV